VSPSSPISAVVGWTAADLHAWQMLAPLAGGYLPWSSAAIRPSALVAVLNDVAVHDRTVVLECGGGVSTVYLARLLAHRSRGRLITLEHDARWVAFLNDALTREGLHERVALVPAPLGVHPLAWEDGWYDAVALAAALPDEPIELRWSTARPRGRRAPSARATRRCRRCRRCWTAWPTTPPWSSTTCSGRANGVPVATARK